MPADGSRTRPRCAGRAGDPRFVAEDGLGQSYEFGGDDLAGSIVRWARAASMALAANRSAASMRISCRFSAATAWRRTRETIRLIAALAPGIRDALAHTKRSGAAFVTLDRTLVHIDRNQIDGPFYSGKHKRQGMNLQAIADARGNLLWISGAIRGSIHDTEAARIWQIPRLLAQHGLFALGDKGHDGLDHDLVVTPTKGKDKPEWQKEYNRLHAQLRGPGESRG